MGSWSLATYSTMSGSLIILICDELSHEQDLFACSLAILGQLLKSIAL
ncbi:hypothetical protein ABFY09_06480 [Marinomonas sp. 5E14-1]